MEIFWYIYNFRLFFGFFWQFTVLTISSSVFIQILWFLAHFKGNLKYYQIPVRTKVNQYFKTGLFAVFLFRKWKTRTAGPVFSGLFPVQSRSWIGLKTGLTNTSLAVGIASHKLLKPYKLLVTLWVDLCHCCVCCVAYFEDWISRIWGVYTSLTSLAQ